MDFTKAPGFGERFTFPENVAITINGAEIGTIREAAIRMVERWEDAVVSEIVKEARLAGYTEVTVLNKPFIFDAFWEKMERENRKPLTVDELRRMHGEPVWIEFLDPCETCPAHWRIHDNNIMDCEWESYGTHWVAYRHKGARKDVGR